MAIKVHVNKVQYCRAGHIYNQQYSYGHMHNRLSKLSFIRTYEEEPRSYSSTYRRSVCILSITDIAQSL